jgi:hypothetical protein
VVAGSSSHWRVTLPRRFKIRVCYVQNWEAGLKERERERAVLRHTLDMAGNSGGGRRNPAPSSVCVSPSWSRVGEEPHACQCSPVPRAKKSRRASRPSASNEDAESDGPVCLFVCSLHQVSATINPHTYMRRGVIVCFYSALTSLFPVVDADVNV